MVKIMRIILDVLWYIKFIMFFLPVRVIIIRPHHSTMYVDVAYCYRQCGLLVGLSVCHDHEPCKNGLILRGWAAHCKV